MKFLTNIMKTKNVNNYNNNRRETSNMNNEQLLEEANYYLDNEVTMADAATHFKICEKSFQLHMKKLEQIYPDTFKLVEMKKQNNLILGAIKGGKNGVPTRRENSSRKHSITKEEAIILAEKIINFNWSLRETERFMNIPKSTISDNLSEEILGEELYSELSNVLNKHKPGNHKL